MRIPRRTRRKMKFLYESKQKSDRFFQLINDFESLEPKEYWIQHLYAMAIDIEKRMKKMSSPESWEQRRYHMDLRSLVDEKRQEYGLDSID